MKLPGGREIGLTAGPRRFRTWPKVYKKLEAERRR